jgi:hypothetical protein
MNKESEDALEKDSKPMEEFTASAMEIQTRFPDFFTNPDYPITKYYKVELNSVSGGATKGTIGFRKGLPEEIKRELLVLFNRIYG